MGYVLYNLLLLLATVLSLPYLVVAVIRGERRRWRERFGFPPPLPRGEPVLWIHGVSVGEILAAGPLLDALLASAEGVPTFQLVLSTVTETGQQIARRRYGARARIIYFPFDWPFSVARALERLHPDAVLILETELWPNFLRACSRRGIPVALVSGRLSDRSFRRYRWIRPFMRRVLENFSLLLMQSEEDARRIRALGAPWERVHVVGNLKWDARPPADEAAQAEELAHHLGLSAERPLIVAGSTAPGEEALLLRAFALLRAEHARLRTARLVLAPRRPERFDEVEELLRNFGLPFVRRTRASDREEIERAAIILLDTIGELAALYRMAPVVVIGGSFLASLAHNVIEPLVRGACVIVGPRYSDPHLPACVWRIPVHTPLKALAHALAQAIGRFLLDEEWRARFREAAQRFLAQHRGTTQRVLAHLKPILTEAMAQR